MTLLVVAGARFDLGVDAARVRRVIDAREAAGAPALDLFALLNVPQSSPVTRLIAVGRADGRELLLVARASLEVVTPHETLALPALVTPHAPWLVTLVPATVDGEKPLFAVDVERLPAPIS